MHHQRRFKLTELTKKHNDNIYRLEDMKTRCLKAMEESSKIGEVWLKLAPMVKNRISRIKVEKAVKAKPDIELFLQDAATDSVRPPAASRAGGRHRRTAKFTGLVLGCIEAKLCKQILHLKALAEIYTVRSFHSFHSFHSFWNP